MKLNVSTKLLLGFIGNVGVVLFAAGLLDGLFSETASIMENTPLLLAGLALILIASLEKRK